MPDNKYVHGRSQRLTQAKFDPPDWYGWTAVLAMFLLAAVRFEGRDGVWFFPLLSLGEWLLLPLGVLSLTTGILSLSRIREKTALPVWLAAILPALLWLAAAGLAISFNRSGAVGMDLMLSWAVRLIFPSLAFLPLLTLRPWRDRLMWALAAGVAANAVTVLLQARSHGFAPSDPRLLGVGGFLANQHDFTLLLAVALPILAAWRGGDGEGTKKTLTVVFTVFLLPVLALSACFTLPGLLAGGIGLLVAWAAWRGHAWLLGVFLVFVLLGRGAEGAQERDAGQRRLLADSALMCVDGYRRALNIFQIRPFLGSGPGAFMQGNGGEPADGGECDPWYAVLLGGTGVIGLGMWFVLLAELASRSMGRRFGRRCLWHGGVLGGVAAAGTLGLWTNSLPEGSGAMIGLLIALSILEEPETVSPQLLQNVKRAADKPAGKPAGPTTKQDGAGPVRERRGGDTETIIRQR